MRRKRPPRPRELHSWTPRGEISCQRVHKTYRNKVHVRRHNFLDGFDNLHLFGSVKAVQLDCELGLLGRCSRLGGPQKGSRGSEGDGPRGPKKDNLDIRAHQRHFHQPFLQALLPWPQEHQ